VRAAFFALTPAAAAGGALAMPVLLCLAGAASISASLLRQGVEKRPAALLLLLAFATWAVVSAAWSAHPALPQALKLAALVPLGLAFAAAASRDATAARLTLAGGLAALVILAGLLAVEAAFGLPFNRAAQPEAPLFELGRNMSRGGIVLLALTWTGAAWLISLGGGFRIAAALALLAASAGLSLPFGQLAHTVAFIAGLAVFALGLAAPRLAILMTAAGAAVWTLLAPFVTPLVLSNQRLVEMMPDSWAVRAAMWEYACARIVEQPWIGRGLDASRAVTEHLTVRGLDIRGVQVHPHSASLQIWFETGAVGAVLAATALAFAGLSLSRTLADNKPAAAAAAATIASLGLVANVSYGLWQEWWIATMFVAAALAAAAAKA
jgi:O-antigen ligase